MSHPYLPLFVDDYEAATAHLSVEEDGAYSRLLRLQWRTPTCTLPDDSAWIARKMRVSEADFERLVRPLIEEFFTRSRGRIFQARLKREHDSVASKSEARKEAGKKGGSAKALKNKENAPSKATDLPLAKSKQNPSTQNQNQNQSLFKEPNGSSGGSPPPVAGKPKSDPWEADEEFGRLWSIATGQGRARAKCKRNLWPFWQAARKRWSGEQIVAAMTRYLAADPDVQRTGGPGLHLWLRDKCETWVSDAARQVQAADSLPPQDWAKAIEFWRRDRWWDPNLGPKPDEPGCRAPAHLVEGGFPNVINIEDARANR